MTTGTQILNSKDWQEADLAGRRIIFVNKVAKTPAFQNADAETQHAIIERFGIGDHNPADLAEEQNPFSDVTPATEIKAPQADPSAPAPKSIAQSIQELPLEEQTGLAAGAATGMEAGRREISAAKSAKAAKAAEAARAAPMAEPSVRRSGAQNWAKTMATQELPESLIDRVETMRKTGEGGAQRLIDEDLAKLKKIKDLGAGNYGLSPKNRGQLMLPPEELARLEKEFASQQRYQALKQAVSKGAEKATNLLGKVPFGSTLAGAGAGLEGVEAYNAYKHGDYPLAALHGLGALGAGASLIPHPLTRIGGGALSLATIPAIELYQRLRGNKKPEQ